MEPKQAQKRLSREEFDRISAEIRALVGDKLKDHKDGDAEEFLFREMRKGSHAGH